MTTRVKILAGLITMVACGIAIAQRLESVPTEFEAFALDANSTVAELREIGSVESSDATLTMTVLVVEDLADQDRRMRGVRFDLQSNAAVDHVYLDETQVEALLKDLRDLQDGMDELRTDCVSPSCVQGTTGCWRPERPVRIMCPAYTVGTIGPEWLGLSLGAYTGPRFRLPESTPWAVGELLQRGIESLASL